MRELFSSTGKPLGSVAIQRTHGARHEYHGACLQCTVFSTACVELTGLLRIDLVI
jgi:hypothetical protein